MSTDTPLCTFVPAGMVGPCGAPQGSHRHSYRPLGRFGMGLMSHPFVPPIERTLDDAVKDMHARWARQYDEFIAYGKGPAPAGSVVNLDTGEAFVPIPDSGVPEPAPDACHFRLPGRISCGKSKYHYRHSDNNHGFVSAAEYARTQADKPSREYLVDPIGQILCTFRLAGGPCGLDSFDTVHRAHTDHPGYCGVYTCHEFRPEEDRAKRIEDAVREAIKELRTNICTREVIASYLEGALG